MNFEIPDVKLDSPNCIMIGLIISLIIYILFFMTPKTQGFNTSSITNEAKSLAQKALAGVKSLYSKATASGFNTMPLAQIQAQLAQTEKDLSYILDKTGAAVLPVTTTSEKILLDTSGRISYNISSNYPLVPEIARKQASKLIASLPPNDPIIRSVIELLATDQHGRQLINTA